MSGCSPDDASSIASRLLLLDEGDAPLLRPPRLVDPNKFGNLGVRSPKGRLRSFRVDLRLRVPNWRTNKNLWGGSFADRDQAKRAVDALLHYSGETPHHFVYPRGFFERAPPEFEGAPQTEEFVYFLQSMAIKYARDPRKLPRRRPISGEDLPTKWEEQTASEFESTIVLSEAAVPIPATASTSSIESSSKENINFKPNPEVIRLSSFTDFQLTNQINVVAAVSTPSQRFQIPETSDAAMDDSNFDNDFSIADYYGMENHQTSTSSSLLVMADDEESIYFWRELLERTTLSDDDAHMNTVLPGFMIESDPKAMPGADNPMSSGSIAPCTESWPLLCIESQQSLKEN